MSRIGKLPISVPAGVSIDVKGQSVAVKGPKGQMELDCHDGVGVTVDGDTAVVHRSDEDRKVRALHGLTRKLLANMVEGVSTGFTRVLEINGVGYRAEAKGNALHLALGYSHPIVFQLPDGVQAKVEKQTTITLEGVDRQLLGQVAAMIRELRPPEPYKGKGIKYAEETIRRKAGKAAGTG